MVLELRKQLGQFVQRADAVLNRQTLGERLAFRVIPTAVDADAPCALHIGGEGVANHQCLFRDKVGDSGKDIIKVFPTGFLMRGILRNKNIGEKGHQSAGGQSAALGFRDTVGQDIQAVSLTGKGLAGFQRVRKVRLP